MHVLSPEHAGVAALPLQHANEWRPCSAVRLLVGSKCFRSHLTESVSIPCPVQLALRVTIASYFRLSHALAEDFLSFCSDQGNELFQAEIRETGGGHLLQIGGEMEGGSLPLAVAPHRASRSPIGCRDPLPRRRSPLPARARPRSRWASQG